MEYINLNELCDINIGKTPSRNKDQYWGNGASWLSISDLKDKFILDTKEQITELAVTECNMKIIPKNTVVMSFKLSIGKTAILKQDMYTNEAIANFPIKDKDKLIPEYLYYAIKTLNFDNTDRAVMGATLNKSKLNEILIPYCDINGQKKIVEVLDKAQELVDKRKAQIEELDEIIKSRFIEMFGDPVLNPKGWKCDKLENVTHKITDGKHGDCQNEENSGYYFISAKDINDRKIYTDNARQITKDDFDDTNKRTRLQVDDIVIVNTGVTIGKTSIATHEDVAKNLTFQKSVAIVTVDSNELNSKFLEQYIIFDRDRIYANASGSAQKNWLLSQMRSYKIMVPPIELQNEFTDFINQVDKLKFEMETSLKELKDNFNSLMQKAFKGELFN